MTAIRLRADTKFTIGPYVYNALRALAIDNARNKIEVAGVADITDNTTGTAGTSYAALAVPTVAIDATAAGGVQLTALNTSFGKIENAYRVLSNSINNVRGRLGVSLLKATTGTQVTKDTLPALDLSSTGATGATAADFVTSKAVMANIVANLALLDDSFQHVLDCLGNTREVSAFQGLASLNSNVVALGVAIASTTGTGALAKTDADAFLAAVANNLATFAARWNQIMVQGGLAALTDSSGGTAAAGLVANATPAAAAGAATTSAPKAGFDTQVALIANAVASLSSRLNALRAGFDLPLFADNSTGTASTTIAAESVALVAVDGSTGTVAVDVVSATTAMAHIDNALSSLTAGTNDLANLLGLEPTIPDALGGAFSYTLAAIAATGTGVGATTAVTMLNTAVNTWLTNNRNNISTLAAALNALVGTNAMYKPLSVVAG
jgi:hypothetical protein